MIRKQYIKLLVVILLIGIFAVVLRALHFIDNEGSIRKDKINLPHKKASENNEVIKTKSYSKIIKPGNRDSKQTEKDRKSDSGGKLVKTVNQYARNEKVKFNFSSEIIYSDNIFHYSRDKINEYKQLSNPVKFQGVKSISDTYNETKFVVGKRFKIIDYGFTTLRAFAKGRFYVRNKAKNFGVYGIDVKQGLGKDKTIRLGYSFMPNYFLRTLFDSDYSGDARYRKAKYDKNSIFIRGWMKFAKDLSGWIEYNFVKENYNKDFSERDNNENKVSLGIKKEMGDRITLFARSGFIDIDAKAHNNELEKPDISSRNYLLGTGISAKLTSKLSWDIYYNFQWVNFTTKNDILNDPYHRDRRDKKQDISSELKYYFLKDSSVSLGYKYRVNDVRLGKDANTSVDYDELVGYIENVFFARVNLLF